MFPRGLAHNLRYYTWYFTLLGFITTLPIWVAFYSPYITIGQMGILTAVETITIILLEIPTGAIADLLGRRSTIALGMLLRASFPLSLPFVNSFIGFLFCVILNGIGNALTSGADNALLYDTLKESKREDEFGKIYNSMLFKHRVAIIIGSLLAGPLFSIWRGAPYIARGIAYLLSAGSALLLVEPIMDTEKFHFRRYLTQTTNGVREILKNNYTKQLAAFYVIIGAVTWGCMTYFNQPFAYSFGWGTKEMSIFTGVAYIVSSGTVYYIVSRHKLLTREKVYFGFPILLSLALLPGLIVGKFLAIVLMTLSQVVGSARFSILDKYINQEFSSKNRATALSTLSMCENLIMSVLVIFGSKIAEYSSMRYTYSLLGLLTIILAFPLAISLVREHNRYQLTKQKAT